MGDLRKITVEVPFELLESAQAETGKGVSETVREGLRKLASTRAQKRILAMAGKVKFDVDLMVLRKQED